MKISELIKELQSHQDEFGDLDMYFENEYTCASEEIESTYYDVIRKDKEGNPLEVGITVGH